MGFGFKSYNTVSCCLSVCQFAVVWLLPLQSDIRRSASGEEQDTKQFPTFVVKFYKIGIPDCSQSQSTPTALAAAAGAIGDGRGFRFRISNNIGRVRAGRVSMIAFLAIPFHSINIVLGVTSTLPWLRMTLIFSTDSTMLGRDIDALYGTSTQLTRRR